jgi:hypothetical protein
MDYGARPMPRWPLLALLCAACARTLPTPPPAASRLPPGCEASLEGPWALASDPSWRYLARDDGGTVELLVTRTGAPPDAGWRPRRFLPRPDGGAAAGPREGGDDGGAAVRLVLERGPEGLVGLTRVAAAGGCAAVFRTEALGCEDGGLVLRSQASLAVGEGCAALPGPDRVDRLVR